MQPSWLLPAASLLAGIGGVGTLLGVFVQRQNNRMAASATTVGQAMDGLTKLTVEQRAELNRLYKQLADRDERIEQLEADAKRRGKR